MVLSDVVLVLACKSIACCCKEASIDLAVAAEIFLAECTGRMRLMSAAPTSLDVRFLPGCSAVLVGDGVDAATDVVCGESMSSSNMVDGGVVENKDDAVVMGESVTTEDPFSPPV